MDIKKARLQDLDGIAKIASENFSGFKNIKDARRWVRCNFSTFPRAHYFIAKGHFGEVSGYIFWIEKGGFRRESVWELEQIAVKKTYQGQGIGTHLVKESLSQIKEHLKKRGSVLKLVEVTTGTNNKAQNLYKKILGAKPECVIKNFFRGDETIMIARFK